LLSRKYELTISASQASVPWRIASASVVVSSQTRNSLRSRKSASEIGATAKPRPASVRARPSETKCDSASRKVPTDVP